LRRNSSMTKDSSGGWRAWQRRTSLSAVEIVALVGALAFVVSVAFFYFYNVQPLKAELATLQAREVELTARLKQINVDEQKRTEQATNADSILSSLRQFEAYLKPDERGMTQIINEVDLLGKTHKVVIGDASYRVDESEQPTEEGVQAKQSNDKKQRIYPALGIDTVVIGEYPNLRRFLADLERSRQFLIINGIVFQGESDQVRRQATKAGGPKLQLSSPEAIPVSLKIEMDTYFQAPLRVAEQSAAKSLAPAATK
jgi:hypothetical protein